MVCTALSPRRQVWRHRGQLDPDGKHPKHLRSDADSIPLEQEAKGKKHLTEDSDARGQVHTGKGDADNTRMCTIHVAAFSLPKGLSFLQPKAALIFRRLGGPHYDKERTGRGFSNAGLRPNARSPRTPQAPPTRRCGATACSTSTSAAS